MSGLFLYEQPILPKGFSFPSSYVELACFDGNDHSGNPKVYFHDYGYDEQYPDWDKRYHLNNFDEWLKLAKEESAQYKAERAESE